MNLRRRSTAGGALSLVAATLVTAGFAPTAGAAAPAPRTYPGPAYSNVLPLPPTQPESQSKLWFHADAWWALLMDPAGNSVRVHELMPDHTWRPTSAVVLTDVGLVGDTVRDGDTVHVATRRLDESLQYVSLSFDAATREYTVAPPRLVTSRGSLAPPAVAVDTTGRLWIAYATYTDIVYTYSDTDGATWAPPAVLSSTGRGDTAEAADLVAFDDRIGLLWSDQATGSFLFASHRDGAAPSSWDRETALSGPAEADDHIFLMRVPGEPGDRLVAAVKTSQGDLGEPPEAPLIEVLLRSAEGQWSRIPVGTVGDQMNDPILAVDESTQTLHVFTSLNGNIIEKRAPLADIRFPPGPGNLFVLGISGGSRGDRGLVDPTVANHPVDADSGLVVLASDDLRFSYRHAELQIGTLPVADPADQSPPSPPARLEGSALSTGTVSLSWAAATDGDRWWPTADGVPVREYVVLRDGTELGTVTGTSFVDDAAPTAGGSANQLSSTYEVQAVDVSGNRSEAARLVVQLPDEASSTPTRVGLGLLLLAAVTGAVALHRRRLAPSTRTAASTPVVDERASDDATLLSAR